jgi:hypothetical protein
MPADRRLLTNSPILVPVQSVSNPSGPQSLTPNP